MSAAPDREEVKLYFDFKSPFAFLAAEPAFALPDRFRIRLRWIPYVLRIKGQGERSIYSDWKAQYSYLDARRWANARGGIPIKGPLKIFDSRPALIGGLFAEREGFFRRFTLEVYARFFRRELAIDEIDAVAALIDELGHSGEAYRGFLAGEGASAFDACVEEGHADHVFGVPLFRFRDEPFWGYDRMPLLEERLASAQLRV